LFEKPNELNAVVLCVCLNYKYKLANQRSRSRTQSRKFVSNSTPTKSRAKHYQQLTNNNINNSSSLSNTSHLSTVHTFSEFSAVTNYHHHHHQSPADGPHPDVIPLKEHLSDVGSDNDNDEEDDLEFGNKTMSFELQRAKSSSASREPMSTAAVHDEYMKTQTTTTIITNALSPPPPALLHHDSHHVQSFQELVAEGSMLLKEQSSSLFSPAVLVKSRPNSNNRGFSIISAIKAVLDQKPKARSDPSSELSTSAGRVSQQQQQQQQQPGKPTPPSQRQQPPAESNEDLTSLDYSGLKQFLANLYDDDEDIPEHDALSFSMINDEAADLHATLHGVGGGGVGGVGVGKEDFKVYPSFSSDQLIEFQPNARNKK
jgi:hypothetical protein